MAAEEVAQKAEEAFEKLKVGEAAHADQHDNIPTSAIATRCPDGRCQERAASSTSAPIPDPAGTQLGNLTYPYKKIYTEFNKLGNGTFGCIYEAREASTGKVFAMKMLSEHHENFHDYRLAHQLMEKESNSVKVMRLLISRKMDYHQQTKVVNIYLDYSCGRSKSMPRHW